MLSICTGLLFYSIFIMTFSQQGIIANRQLARNYGEIVRIEQEIAEYYQRMQTGTEVDIREANRELQMLYEEASQLRPQKRSPAADQVSALIAGAVGFLTARVLLYIRMKRRRDDHTD